jgi:hypothetical protein
VARLIETDPRVAVFVSRHPTAASRRGAMNPPSRPTVALSKIGGRLDGVGAFTLVHSTGPDGTLSFGTR